MLCILLPYLGFGQIDGNKASLALHAFVACPQNDFDATGYDHGGGMGISYLSKHFEFVPFSFQYGARMDFAGMKSKTFDVALATTVPDNGELKVKNSMYGTFLEGRFNLKKEYVRPYFSVLVGHRSYSTSNTITANNPELNPDTESVSYDDRVVYTNRFHAGGSLGVSYVIDKRWQVDAGATYTWGGSGTVQPLKDVYQLPGKNEVVYDYTTSRTDILLIQAGFRMVFLGTAGRQIERTPTNTPDYRESKPRTTPPTQIRERGSDTPTEPSPTPKTDPPVKKKPIQMKGDRKDENH